MSPSTSLFQTGDQVCPRTSPIAKGEICSRYKIRNKEHGCESWGSQAPHCTVRVTEAKQRAVSEPGSRGLEPRRAEPRPGPVMNHQAEPRSHQVSLWPSIMQQALGFSLKASSSAALSSSASPRASVYPWKGAKTHLTVFFLKTLGMEPGTSNTLPAPGQY